MKKVVENEVKLQVGQEVLSEDGVKFEIEEGDRIRIISEGSCLYSYELYHDNGEGVYFLVFDRGNNIIFSHVYDDTRSNWVDIEQNIRALSDPSECGYISSWDGNDYVSKKTYNQMLNGQNSGYSFIKEG